MNKKERVLQILNALTCAEENTFFKFEVDTAHKDGFNINIPENSFQMEPGPYNIAVLDDSVCFHRFAVRGSVFMYYASEADECLFSEVEFASTHDDYLKHLQSTDTILQYIVPLLEMINEDMDEITLNDIINNYLEKL